MFENCISLVAAPKLPATELVSWTYVQMFRGCTSLTTAPELPATELVDFAYNSMFENSNKLNYVKANFLTTVERMSWLTGVSTTGTFVKNKNATWDRETAGIPSGWTIISE